MDDKQFKEILKKLDIITRLLAVQCVGDKNDREAIEKFSAAGLEPSEIADLIGTTANSVRVQLHGIKKKQGKKNA